MIASRHKESGRMQEKDITALNDNMWKVASISSERNYYVVKEADECPIQCCMRCTECDICIHTYTCTCPDALIRHTICKHVHAVMRFDKAINLSSQVKSDCHDRVLSCKQEIICSTFATVKQQRNEFKTERDRIVEKLPSSQHRSSNAEARLHFRLQKHTNCASNIINVLTHSDELQHQSIGSSHSNAPANKKVAVQMRYFSTRKRKRCTNIRLSKPSYNEKKAICTHY